MKPAISVVVNTLNEGPRIALTLRSVRPWAKEIIVVDMCSDDDTVEIARSLGARVVSHARLGFVEPVRAFSCAQAQGEWTLLLDADELVPAPLARELRRIATEDAAEVVRIPRLNHLLGSPLLHSGWNPDRDRHARFFKAGRVVFSDQIHEPPRAAPGARVMDLPFARDHALVHFNYVDTAHFLRKLDAYTSIEARQAFDRGERPSSAKALWRSAREFLVRYLRHGGWRDGWRGLHLSVLMAGYEIARSSKLHELARVGDGAKIAARYREEAEALIALVEADVDPHGAPPRTTTEA